MSRRWPALALLLALAGCAREDIRPYAVNRSASLWQNVAQGADRSRLAALTDAWTLAMADLSQPERDQLALLGPVAQPPLSDAAADTAPMQMAPGAYRCRLIRMGRRHDAPAEAPGLVVDAALPCRVTAGPVPVLATSGPTRISGGLYQDSGRLVLLGSMALGDEAGWRAYGQDAARSLIGALTPVGPGHWRLVLPWPRWQNKLWLVEISAAG
jgi:hypothetical protein